MRYGRDYGARREAYDRMYFRPGEPRGGSGRGPGSQPRGGMRYDSGMRRGGGYAGQGPGRGGRGRDPRNRQGGWASSYPGAFARGIPGATPYQRYGMADAHLWTTPWNHPIPGTGVGYSLPYGMGRGRWL